MLFRLESFLRRRLNGSFSTFPIRDGSDLDAGFFFPPLRQSQCAFLPHVLELPSLLFGNTMSASMSPFWSGGT